MAVVTSMRPAPIIRHLRALAAVSLLLVGSAILAAIQSPVPADWKRWSPRDEIAPEFSLAAGKGHDGRDALQITSRSAFEFGAWRTTLSGVKPGQAYRFEAWYRCEHVANEQRSVSARLQWLEASGRPLKALVRPPEFPSARVHTDGWSHIDYVTWAPEEAAAVDIQLSLGFAAAGSVTWDRISLTEIDTPPRRPVRVMTVFHRPPHAGSPEKSVAAFLDIVRNAAPEQKPDVVCLPEGVTVVGTKHRYVEVGEPVPGPTTEQIGRLAREIHAYVVAGLYERVGPVVYNTAVLLDREGRLAGRYRKTHLPREEWEAGLTPGDEYPVFQTDFGRIGILVCWDVQFPEPWSALGRKGAEMILLPAWGGNETLLLARAMENHVYVVSSSYDMKTCIIAPDGKIRAEATKEKPAVTAAIDLEEKIYQPWIGDMRARVWKERRDDLPR